MCLFSATRTVNKKCKTTRSVNSLSEENYEEQEEESSDGDDGDDDDDNDTLYDPDDEDYIPPGIWVICLLGCIPMCVCELESHFGITDLKTVIHRLSHTHTHTHTHTRTRTVARYLLMTSHGYNYMHISKCL